MSARFQFSLRALLVLILAVSCFFAGDRFGRDRQRHEDLLAEQIARKKGLEEARAFRERLQQEIQAMEEKLQRPPRGKIEETYDKVDAPKDFSDYP